MSITPPKPGLKLKQGAIVRCRTRRYVVRDVEPPAHRKVPEGGDRVVTLDCMEDDAIGQRLTVFPRSEVDFELLAESTWEVVAQRGFDQPRQFSAYLNTLRWNCVTATDPLLFQAPYRAGIEVKTYQLEPLRKALQMPRVGLFIADDVGLGKTIEAGLILREMLLRQRVRRVVISCPPSVLRQWQEEMAQRFGLAFTVMDRAYVAKVRQERGYGTNPWSTGSRFLISHALLRQGEITSGLIDWLEQGQERDSEAPSQSLLILDEAHHAAPASNSLRYAIDSGFTRGLRDLAPRFEHRLFLSATPHNGHSNSFSALLELLDPTRFTRGVPIDPSDLEVVMVRRLKDDLRQALHEDFPERIVEPLRIPRGTLASDCPELALSRLLQRYRRLRENRLRAEGANKRQRMTDQLVITNLQKRLLSSIEAFARTLAVHQRTREARRERAGDAQLETLRGGVEADSDWAELADEEVLALEETQTMAALSRTPMADQEEEALLADMATIAKAHRHRPDPRIHRLAAWLKEHLCPNLAEPAAAGAQPATLQWQPTRLLIFTDYVDTKRYLERQLRELLGDEEADLRLASFSGGLGEEQRETLKARFNADPDEDPLRILIATDAAREGVNLQNHCKHLIHFDIPWNPSKLEQRNGRIDRKLQQAPQVWCHYFLLEDRPEDRVMEVMVRKTEVIRKELGSLSPLVQRQVDEALSEGIDHEQAEALQGQLEALDSAATERGALLRQARQELVPPSRETVLQAEQEALRQLLAKSKDWLAHDDDPFCEALNCSLELLGVSGLVRHTDDRGEACWRLVQPEALAAKCHDSSWENTLDSLRGVRPPLERLSDWRRDNPVRPLIFSDPGRLNADAVHLHLEHRLVQRLLSRFLSQGFLHHELSRACVIASREPRPRVAVVGRLSLFGQGAARLHDELITVMAFWHSGDDRAAALKPLSVERQREIWRELSQELQRAESSLVSDAMRAELQATAPADVAALLPRLQETCDAALEAATTQLKERGRQEAEALKEALRHQRHRIRATLQQRSKDLARLERKAADQLTAPIPGLQEDTGIAALDLEKMTAQERRQLAADQRHWQRRLEAIEAELSREPKRIEASYEVVTHRLEPAGLVYLWPISG